jgi:large subunit ribosomal protein L4e
LNSKDFLNSLKNILGELYTVSIQKKTVRAGKGKGRGRKYKKNAGLLLVIGTEEKMRVTGIDVIKANEIRVSDLADCGARITIFTEKSIKDLESLLKRTLGKNRKEK